MSDAPDMLLADAPEDVQSYVKSEAFQQLCQDHFDSADANGDGSLSRDELKPVYTTMMGVLFGEEFKDTAKPPSDDEIQGFIDEIDTDGDGNISRDEFVSVTEMMIIDYIATMKDYVETMTDVNTAAVAYDTTVEEVERYFASEEFQNMAMAVFEEQDADGSGFLEKDEVTTVINQLMEEVSGLPEGSRRTDPLNTIEIAAMMERFDENQDGRISRDEFPAFFKFISVTSAMNVPDDDE